MTGILFEDPLYLLILLAGGEFYLYSLWHKEGTFTFKDLRKLLILPLIALGIWIMSTVVVTEKEEILNIMAEFSEKIERGPMPLLEKYLHADYSGHSLNQSFATKSEAMSFVKKHQDNKLIINGIRFQKKKFTIKGKKATLQTKMVLYITTQRGDGPFPLNISLVFQKTVEGWKILQNTPPTIATINLR